MPVTITLFILAIATSTYVVFIILMYDGLKRARIDASNENALPPVSIIIAARNEESNISHILDDIIKQDYPKNLLHVFIANDRSTDATPTILRKYSAQYDFIHDIHIHQHSTEMAAKKNALTQCIKHVKTEMILSCDADIRLGLNWVKAMVQGFTENTGVMTSYSSVTGNNLFARYQALDFLALQVSNGAMLNRGYNWSGTGQNIAYRKSAFIQIDGFRPSAHKDNDDDMYLIQTIPKQTGRDAKFNWNPEAMVQTHPTRDFKSFMNQRIRWASNSKGLEKSKPLFFIFLLSAYLTNLGILMSLFFAPFSPVLWISILVKFLGEGAILLKGSSLMNERRLIMLFPLWFMIQPLYISFMGIAGRIGKYSWKA